jgi:hypothetical protein
MMANEELKQAILQYTKRYYERNKEPPSLREILEHFKRKKLNFTRFYGIFTKGMSEVCRLADIPVSASRLKMTERATKAAKKRKQLNAALSNQGPLIPFSRVFYVDEDGDKHTLEKFIENMCGDFLDLDGNVRAMMEDLASTMKKVEDLESNFKERVFDALNLVCPRCGGKIVFNVTCLNCEKKLLLDISEPPQQS